MNDFKIYGRCVGCKRDRWFVRKATVKIPTGDYITSKDLMCGKHIKELRDKMNKYDG